MKKSSPQILRKSTLQVRREKPDPAKERENKKKLKSLKLLNAFGNQMEKMFQKQMAVTEDEVARLKARSDNPPVALVNTKTIEQQKTKFADDIEEKQKKLEQVTNHQKQF